MNETPSNPSNNTPEKTDHPVIDSCANQAKKVADSTKNWAGPAVSIVSYGLIIGFALTGIGTMAISALVWALFNTSLFPAFGLLTGGLFLSAATALFLGKLTKAGDALYQRRQCA